MRVTVMVLLALLLPWPGPPARAEEAGAGGARQALERHWRDLVADKGLDALVTPLLPPGVALPPAGDGLLQPVIGLQGPLRGFARVTCPANDEARVELLDLYGGSVGLATFEDCPVLASPLDLSGGGAVPALLAVYRGEAAAGLVVPTPAGGLVVPLDLPGLTVTAAADADGDGFVETITLSTGEKSPAITCPLGDAPALIACADRLQP